MSAPTLINFTVRHNQWFTTTDSGDGGVDADVVALIGEVTFTPVFDKHRSALAAQYAAQMGPITGYLDTDGALKASKGGAVGVRLPANDPVLNLQSLPYKVEFGTLATAAGTPVQVAGVTFTAPAVDETLWLSSVLPVPGASAQGLSRGVPGAPLDDVQYNAGTGNVEFYVESVLIGTVAATALMGAVIDGAPGALDTLNELAAALGDDPNFATTITSALALKQNISDAYTLGARSPALASKLLGGNIVTKAGYDWRYLWAEWDWTNWIKPQVDRAIKLGLNSIRFIGAPRVVTDSTIQHSAWAGSTAYSVDDPRVNGTREYICTTAGTSASSGGPTGTGSAITDGTVVWKYVRLNNLVPLTQSQYDARWVQLVQYCAANGMTVYPCLCQHQDFETLGVGGYQNTALTASIVTTAGVLADYPNVVGYDIFQEGDNASVALTGRAWTASTAYALNAYVNLGGKSYKATTAGTSAGSGGPTGTGSSISDGSVVWAYQGVPLLAADVLALLTAIRAVCTVPVTMSFYTGSGNPQWGTSWTDTLNFWYLCLTDATTGGLDFIDLHVYSTGLVPSTTIELFAALVGKPIVIGEYGTNQAAVDQVARYATIPPLVARPGVRGAYLWALADQGSTTSGQAGVWDNTGFVQANELGAGSPLSTSSGVRASLAAVLRTVPIAQPTGGVDLTSTQTLTNKTLTTAKFNVLKDTNGNTIISFSPTASAVNYVQIANGAAAGSPWILAEGTDTNIGVVVVPKGNEFMYVRGATGAAATIKAAGPDTNHDLNLVSKAAGVVTANGVQVATIPSVVTVSTTTTLTVTSAGSYYVRLSSGAVLTIPTAVGFTGTITLKNVDTASHSVAFTSAQTVDGATTLTLPPNAAVSLISNQTNWEIY